jgi:hypothetical protein
MAAGIRPTGVLPDVNRWLGKMKIQDMQSLEDIESVGAEVKINGGLFAKPT